MTNSARRPRVLIGLVLLVVGVVTLVDNLSDWDFPWGDWWPVILIAIGVSKLVRRKPSWVGGATITGLGVIFLLDTLDIWGFSIGDIWRLWPVLLVVVGASILLGGRKVRSRHRDARHTVDDSHPGE